MLVAVSAPAGEVIPPAKIEVAAAIPISELRTTFFGTAQSSVVGTHAAFEVVAAKIWSAFPAFVLLVGLAMRVASVVS